MAHFRRKQARHDLVRTAIAGAAALTLLSVALPTVAQAEENANIKELRFDVPPTNFPSTINVTSAGGNKWDTIQDGSVTFLAHMKVDTKWPGYVEQVGVFLGQCNNHQCAGYPLLFHKWVAARDYEEQKDLLFSSAKIPVSDPGIAVVSYGDDILRECNRNLTADGPTQQHTFTQQMRVSFSVNTRKASGSIPPAEVVDAVTPPYRGGEVTSFGTITARIVCQPKPMQQTAELRVGNIELFQSTYVNQKSRPNPATECKKVRVLVRLETNREGPVKLNLWTKIGDGPSSRKYIDAWASSSSDGNYKAEYAEWVEVTKTTVVQSMAEDLTNPIGQSTGWKDITLHCTGVGGGGLTDAPRDPNRSTPPQRLVGQATQTPPTISCIGGLSTGSTCICRQPTVKVQTGPNAYRCVMDGLTTGQSHSAPQRLVGPANSTPPAISCIGGTSTGTFCICRQPTVKVQTGPNSFRCVMDGMTTGPGHGGPFVNRFDNRPRFQVGPAPAQGGQPFARPLFNRQSSLPQRGLMQ